MLCTGRVTIVALAIAFSFVANPIRVGMYNYLVVLGGLMIAAWYGPLIIADAIDGRSERGDNTTHAQ
jgi:hypothetical protein